MNTKKYIWSFMGQVKNKPTREKMLLKLKNVKGKHFLHITEKWNDENQIKITEYKKILSDSIFVPCPSGWGGALGLKDCFRLYETLEAGSIPIIEKDEHLYFDSFFPQNPLLKVSNDWQEVDETINDLLNNPEKLSRHAKEVANWWSKYKENLKQSIKNKFTTCINELAIVVQSCDNYEFLWEGWKHNFLKNWDFSIPAKIYFCTEEKDFCCKNVFNIKTGKQNKEGLSEERTFSGRLKNAIGQIQEKYVLYLQEDMWPHEPINKNLFLECYDYFKDKKLNAFTFGYKLALNRKFKMNNEIFSIDDFKEYKDIYICKNQVYNRLPSINTLKSSNPFLITHHSCFFKKDFLQKYLCVEGESPIENEIESSHRISRDHINQNTKIQGIDHKWYEHVCEGGKLNQIGKSLTSPKTRFISIDRNISIQNKWKTILHQLKSGFSIFAVSTHLYPINSKQTIQQYINPDTDLVLCEHDYNSWGRNLESSLSSAYIYIKSSPHTIELIEKLKAELLNTQEDDRFFSYKEQYADHELQKLIELEGSKLNVKKIKNDEFAVSEEIYGKNIEHYKSNPPAYINFDRNVYTEELKKVYFNASSHNK